MEPGTAVQVSSPAGLLLHTFSAYETIFGLVLKENASLVKSVRILDVKFEVQMCPCTFALVLLQMM